MRSQILDVEGEDLLVLETFLEQIVYSRNIDLLFNLQLVVVGEVERHRHVGLPHATLHVEHGQGVGGAFVEGEFFVLIILIRNFALLLEFDFFAVEVDRFATSTFGVNLTACFVGADIGGYGVGCSVSRLSKFQQTGRFTVRAADIQHQLTVNVDPHIIVTGEEELDGDLISGIIPYLNLTVIGQCKVKLQLRTKAVVVLGCTTITNALVEREETVEGGAVVEEKELHQVSVEKVIDEYLTEKYPFARFICEKEIGVVLALSQEQTVNELLGVFDQIQKVCRQVFGLQISIGVGSRKQWIRQVPQSFMEAKEASGYRAVPDMGSVIYIRDVEPKKTETLIFEEQEKNALIHAVKFEQEEEIACELTKIIGRIADGKIYSRQCKSYVISILNSILQVVWSNELEEQRIFGYGTDCYEQVLHMKTTEEVEQFLLKLCCEIHTQLVQRRENMTIDIIKEAKEYIQENYANPELSVEMLCSSLHLSPSYFSTVFKKETGQNYVAYLTDVRLNKAVELLNHTDDKTYIIAAKVGYPEPNYFSYVFKKKFGVSPSKYKGKS